MFGRLSGIIKKSDNGNAVCLYCLYAGADAVLGGIKVSVQGLKACRGQKGNAAGNKEPQGSAVLRGAERSGQKSSLPQPCLIYKDIKQRIGGTKAQGNVLRRFQKADSHFCNQIGSQPHGGGSYAYCADAVFRKIENR